MSNSSIEMLTTPRRDDLGLLDIANSAGISASLLPSGAIFAIEHVGPKRRIMINQVFASPIAGGMGRLYLRAGGREPAILPVIGPGARLRVGASNDRFVWEGEEKGVGHRVALWLHPRSSAWFWRLDIVNRRDRELSCDAVFIQDLGLGDQGFLMNNEAYASQYMDHHVAQHSRLTHVLMSRQNLSQGGTYPWAAHGCLEGAAGFATDYRQLMGPSHRDADQFRFGFGTGLPSERLQFETGCAALQSKVAALAPGAATSWTFFGLFEPDHPAASSDADLSLVESVERAAQDWTPREVALAIPPRSLLHDGPCAVAELSTRTRSGRATAGARTSNGSRGDFYHSSLREEPTAVMSSCATRSASWRAATGP